MTAFGAADGFSVLSIDGTMKIAMGVRRRDTGTSLPLGSSEQDRVDHNTCVSTTRTLQGAVLDLAVVPSDSKPHVVESALANAVRPDDRGECPLGSRQRFAGLAHSRSAGLSASSTCPSLSEAPLDKDILEPFRGDRNRQLTDNEWFFYNHLCRASLPQEYIDAAVSSMKSADVWSGLAEWIRALAAVATLYPDEVKNNHSRKGKSRLRLLMAAATFPRYQWYLNNARIRSALTGQQAALLGTGTCGNEVMHAELRGIFRQAYNVSLPTFRLKLDLFKLSKQVALYGARRIPMLRQMNQGRAVEGDVFQPPRSPDAIDSPIICVLILFFPRSSLGEGPWAPTAQREGLGAALQ